MIRFEDVTMRYAKEPEPALDEVSLEIARGEFAFVVGASGSGKSTLLKLMTRELIASAGELWVAGRDLRTLPDRKVPALRRDIGVVYQDFRLLEDKTVTQNVAFVLQVLGRKRHEIKQLVPEALELVGLRDKGNRRPHQLSGGEQQRVAIARAVAHPATCLLADEPTSALDAGNRRRMLQLLHEQSRAGRAVVVTTNDPESLEGVADEIVDLDAG